MRRRRRRVVKLLVFLLASLVGGAIINVAGESWEMEAQCCDHSALARPDLSGRVVAPEL
jgi:hypothetical protein